jgi:transposase-like protein
MSVACFPPGFPDTTTPRVITVDKNAAYPKAVKELKEERAIPDS